MIKYAFGVCVVHLWRAVGSVLALMLLSGPGMVAQAQTQKPVEINVSYLSAVYWALPFYVATEKNWWADVGLKPVFSVFPAGVPQVAASAAKSWDVGATGSVPAILGHSRFGIKTIGLSNDESAANVLLVSRGTADKFQKNPAGMKGQTILVTTNTTGDYAVQACLKKYGLSKSDVLLKNMGQAEIISAVSSGNADVAGLWAPNSYMLEEKGGAVSLCSGADAGVVVPGALIVRKEYAEQNPELVARFLAVYLRAWAWMNANPDEAMVMMKRFYAQGGVNISDAAMRKEFASRPTFGLNQQLAKMNRVNGTSEVDTWFTQIGAFMKGSGAIRTVPNARDYIDDSYMKRVNADARLREFASRTQ